MDLFDLSSINLQLVAGALGAGLLAWTNRAKLKELLAGVLPAKQPTDVVKDRVLLCIELRAKCVGACPEAVKHLDAAFLHLLPGHTEETK